MILSSAITVGRRKQMKPRRHHADTGANTEKEPSLTTSLARCTSGARIGSNNIGECDDDMQLANQAMKSTADEAADCSDVAKSTNVAASSVTPATPSIIGLYDIRSGNDARILPPQSASPLRSDDRETRRTVKNQYSPTSETFTGHKSEAESSLCTPNRTAELDLSTVAERGSGCCRCCCHGNSRIEPTLTGSIADNHVVNLRTFVESLNCRDIDVPQVADSPYALRFAERQKQRFIDSSLPLMVVMEPQLNYKSNKRDEKETVSGSSDVLPLNLSVRKCGTDDKVCTKNDASPSTETPKTLKPEAAIAALMERFAAFTESSSTASSMSSILDRLSTVSACRNSKKRSDSLSSPNGGHRAGNDTGKSYRLQLDKCLTMNGIASPEWAINNSGASYSLGIHTSNSDTATMLRATGSVGDCASHGSESSVKTERERRTASFTTPCDRNISDVARRQTDVGKFRREVSLFKHASKRLPSAKSPSCQRACTPSRIGLKATEGHRYVNRMCKSTLCVDINRTNETHLKTLQFSPLLASPLSLTCFRCAACSLPCASLHDLTLHLEATGHSAVSGSTSLAAIMAERSHILPINHIDSTDSRTPTDSRRQVASEKLPNANRKRKMCVAFPVRQTVTTIRPRRLVRGQDIWISRCDEQTGKIFRCIRCDAAVRSLAELTMHMVRTGHYLGIVGTSSSARQSEPSPSKELRRKARRLSN